MAKELTLQELENNLQKEKDHLKKLIEKTVAFELLIADGKDLFVKGPGKISCVAESEDDLKRKSETGEPVDEKIIYEEGDIIKIEPTLFAKMKKQFVESTILPVLKRQCKKQEKKIAELEEKIAQLQPQGGSLE